MVIKKLSEETINQISAGEVIEGPSDILKELIENSVDANATEITVKVKSSGMEYIEIQDNGIGISKKDLEICLDKYTTSKINSIDDLYNLNSFGFRGEALSSINSISKLKIITSTNNDGKGYVLSNKKISETSSIKGTTIQISDLFYNVPVRKKFLKSKSFEFSKLYDVFLAHTLINPQITFKFISEKKNITFTKTNFDNRFVQIYGFEIKNKTLKIDVANDFFSVTGFITNPANPIYLPTNFLFINKRYIFSPQIYKAITSSYKDYLMIQQKPFFILFITLKPSTLDVNVHPKKRVVKLLNETLFLVEFKKELSKILDKNLGKELPNSSYNSLKDFILPNTSNNSKYNSSFKSNKINFSLKENKPLFSEYKTQQTFNQFSKIDEINLFSHEITRFLGQIHRTFIVCETKKGMLLIDQHAADERINLEKNRVKYSSIIEHQNLITPVILDILTESNKKTLLKNKLIIEKLGFSFILKNNYFYLTTVPLFLNKVFDKNIFLNLINDLENNNNEIEKLKDNLLKLKSCKESIKANQELSISEQIELVKKLSLCSDKGVCAHGRPTIIFISLKDVEKLFKRIV